MSKPKKKAGVKKGLRPAIAVKKSKAAKPAAAPRKAAKKSAPRKPAAAAIEPANWTAAAPLFADRLREFASTHSSLSEKLTTWLLNDFRRGGGEPTLDDVVPSEFVDGTLNMDGTCDRLRDAFQDPSWGVDPAKFKLEGYQLVDDINAQRKKLNAWPKVSWLIGVIYQHVLAARVAKVA